MADNKITTEAEQKDKQHTTKDKSNKDKSNKKNFFVEKFIELKSEYKKIVWPSKNDLYKETVTVIVTSLLIGVMITILDGGFALLYEEFVRLLS